MYNTGLDVKRCRSTESHLYLETLCQIPKLRMNTFARTEEAPETSMMLEGTETPLTAP
jgi:hypothetical protein